MKLGITLGTPLLKLYILSILAIGDTVILEGLLKVGSLEGLGNDQYRARSPISGLYDCS